MEVSELSNVVHPSLRPGCANFVALITFPQKFSPAAAANSRFSLYQRFLLYIFGAPPLPCKGSRGEEEVDGIALSSCKEGYDDKPAQHYSERFARETTPKDTGPENHPTSSDIPDRNEDTHTGHRRYNAEHR